MKIYVTSNKVMCSYGEAWLAFNDRGEEGFYFENSHISGFETFYCHMTLVHLKELSLHNHPDKKSENYKEKYDMVQSLKEDATYVYTLNMIEYQKTVRGKIGLWIRFNYFKLMHKIKYGCVFYMFCKHIYKLGK